MQLTIILHPVRLIRQNHRASCIIRRRRLVTQWKMGNRLRRRRPKPSLEVMASWKDGQFPLSLWSLSLSLYRSLDSNNIKSFLFFNYMVAVALHCVAAVYWMLVSEEDGEISTRDCVFVCYRLIGFLLSFFFSFFFNTKYWFSVEL